MDWLLNLPHYQKQQQVVTQVIQPEVMTRATCCFQYLLFSIPRHHSYQVVFLGFLACILLCVFRFLS